MYPQVFGKYVLERELARGGMARVLLATLRGAGGFEKKLVVKQIRDELALDADFVRRFVEEAKTTVSLSHPNIVPVYELGVEQGTYFLAMELVEGASLAEILDRGDERSGNQHGSGDDEPVPLTPEQGAYVGIEICRALDYAHRRMQVVHRDITPRNVMVDDEGQIKLIDFGIAARTQVGHGERERVFGSPGHMPPEQVEGRTLDPATDLFAVGVLLMELWSGKAPFRRKTPEECNAAMRERHPRPSEINPRLLPLDAIIGSAMELDPANRPATADDLGRALRRFLDDVDLGDLARSLGARAHAARKHARDELAPSSQLGPRGEPSHAEVSTRTFAARDEIQSLSNLRSSSAADEKAEPGTRRLVSVAPPPGDGDRETASDAAKTPSRRHRERQNDLRIETVATRPLETPVHEFAPPGSDLDLDRAPDSHGATRRPWFGIAAAIAVLLTLVGIGLRKSVSRQGEGRHDDPALSAAAHSTVSPVMLVPSAEPPQKTVQSTSIVSAPPASGPSPFSSSPLPTSTLPRAPTSMETLPGTDAKSPAKLVIFCDPGTRVAIDGTPRGGCPIRDLSVEAGAHDVRFVFDPTGESRGERVHVAPGRRVTLRADFTASTPTIRVER